MTKIMFALYRRADLTRDEFRRYWREVHGPIGASMPGVRRYVQNHALADDAPFDGLAEMWFDSPADMQAAFTSDAAQRAAADSQNFLAKTVAILVEEVDMLGT